jgi:hypothetical protein
MITKIAFFFKLYKMKKLFVVVGALLLLFGVERFCHHQTGGFSLSKISTSEGCPEKTIALNKEIFSQPFTFLASGAQTFAFASEDGQYVLKFFRHHRTRHLLRPIRFLLPAPLKSKMAAVEARRALRLDKDFKSYEWAATHLKEETAILEIQLEKRRGHLPITLYDKIGVRHEINGAHYTFILQKRADPFYPTLEKWIESGDLDKARAGLASLCSLLQKRIALGRADKDPDLRTNFGFIGTQVVEFDAGRFRSEKPRENEMALITHRLCLWLEERAPELAKELEERL